MTNREVRRWRKAATLARLAMGQEQSRGVRGSPSHLFWRADEDPLAWWCLTECIYAYGQRF